MGATNSDRAKEPASPNSDGVMNVEDIVIDERYKIQAVGATGYWIVVGKKQNKFEEWEISAKKDLKLDPRDVTAKYNKIRTFRPEQFLEKKEDKRMKKEVISESTEKVGTIKGLGMFIEDVQQWPDEKRRGRKPKNAV